MSRLVWGTRSNKPMTDGPPRGHWCNIHGPVQRRPAAWWLSVSRAGSVLWGENLRTKGNLRKCREDFRIEGCKREVLATGKFNEQGIVHRHPRLNRPFKSTLPQRLAWDGMVP